MKNHKKTTDKVAILHTLNNHLTNINLSAELLAKEVYGPLAAKQKDCIKAIISEGKKIATLAKDLKGE